VRQRINRAHFIGRQPQRLADILQGMLRVAVLQGNPGARVQGGVKVRVGRQGRIHRACCFVQTPLLHQGASQTVMRHGKLSGLKSAILDAQVIELFCLAPRALFHLCIAPVAPGQVASPRRHVDPDTHRQDAHHRQKRAAGKSSDRGMVHARSCHEIKQIAASRLQGAIQALPSR